MKIRQGLILIAFFATLFGFAAQVSAATQEGWYPNIVEYDFVKQHAKIPKSKDVQIVDSRPKKRKYDRGHIPGAASIPDTYFKKLTHMLPEQKDTLLIFYCGGVKCKLSHKSAFKAEALGYTNIKVYADGFPDWKQKGEQVAVSVQRIKALMDQNENLVVIDSRPKKRKYDKGHIPGAISIPDSQFSKMTDQLPADKNTPLYFYCGGLQCKLSSKSAQKAMDLGYTNVMVVPEGYPAWKEAFGTDQSPTIQTGKEEGTISLASFNDVLKNAPQSILLVDVRDPDEYAGGTIRGAINIPIDAMENEMDKLPSDKPILFFCGTAGRAGEAYDMLQMFKPELKAYFLNAEVTLTGGGGYAAKALD